MASEANKHRASTIQIAGFALMTPFGNFIVNLRNYELLNLGLEEVLILLFHFFLAYLGIICLSRSLELLIEEEDK